MTIITSLRVFLKGYCDAILIVLFFSIPVYPSIYDYFPQELTPSSSAYGITGIIQMPNARIMKEGSMKIGFSSSYPYEYTYISASPFDWFEAVYKYTEFENLLYGPSTYSGNQTLKDKGFDIKFKLLEESYLLPDIALGWNDIAGTGRFAGEYLSMTKSIMNADVTIGLGWGALGQDTQFRNPLISLNEQFKFRDSDIGSGGSFNSKSWFSSKEISAYYGIEYYLWKYGTVLKLEYDTTNPDLGYSGPPLEVDSRYNLGLVKPINRNLSLGLSFERGNEWRLSFDIKSDYGKRPIVAKNDTPKNVVKLNKRQKELVSLDSRVFYRSLNRSLREESILLQSADINDKKVEIVIAQNRFRSFPRAIGRAARIASALSPDDVEVLEVVPMNGDLELYSVSISKNDFIKADEDQISKNELFLKTDIKTVEPNNLYENEFRPKVNFPEYFFSMSPSLRHQIGGPEAFYLGQIWWKINAKVKFRRGLTLHSVIGLDLYNNFDEFKNPSFSEIPHVRSDIQEYLSEGENNIARLKLDYIWSPARDLFARLDIGYLEEMFGGVGGEIYYRPFDSEFSASMQLHKVKQRNYDQRFGFRNYEVETGHIGLYYDFPKGVIGQLLVGKYLAGDKGATIDLSRRFKNGFTLGVFATKTDLSSAEFGEGSFDKGFYFSIPMDSFFDSFRQGDIAFGLHPLTKDGGAILNHLNPLYSLYGDTKYNSVLRDWGDIHD
mgnify:CR=1 FL=1